jgi:hypothetical protein
MVHEKEIQKMVRMIIRGSQTLSRFFKTMQNPLVDGLSSIGRPQKVRPRRFASSSPV